MKKSKTLIISLSILALASIAVWLIFMTEPTTQPEAATVETPMLVEVTEVNRADHRPVFVATGNVQAFNDLVLNPLVSGQVVDRSEDFVPGGIVEEGETLLKINPADYQNELELRRSELMQTETDLAMEMGRQKTAEQDLKLAGIDSLSAEERKLVLRQPQLDAIRARVKAARAAVSQAELNLRRTHVKAPFDAHVISQNVTVGSQVAPGDNLGRLVGTDFYWVILSIPVSQLKWLDFPTSEEEKGTKVKIMNRSAWSENEFRIGYLARRIGALNQETRLARVLVRVTDPLAKDSENENLPQLMVGSFVEAHLMAGEIEDVIRINRSHVRKNNTVWVMQDGKLSIREADIVLTDPKYAYIRKGLEDNDKLVTTSLSTISEGIRLRTKGSDSQINNRNPNDSLQEL